ncbi:nuclear transport factor 2 family protein [Streptomyces sp. M19]
MREAEPKGRRMNPRPPAEPDGTVFAQVQQLYNRQSQLIDAGRAAEWAATFTADATFDSPSYPEPVTGTAALTAFAERFAATAAADQVVRRHVVTNLVVETESPDSLRVLAYLQIVATRAAARPHRTADHAHRPCGPGRGRVAGGRPTGTP